MPQTPEERKEKARWARILRVYGLTREQYTSLISDNCPICLRPFGGSITPCIDHNHTTGEIRGIICRTCNHRVIGRHTDPFLLERAAAYLHSRTGWIVPPKPKRKKKKRGGSIRVRK